MVSQSLSGFQDFSSHKVCCFLLTLFNFTSIQCRKVNFHYNLILLPVDHNFNFSKHSFMDLSIFLVRKFVFETPQS